MSKLSADITERQTVRFSVAPKPVQYSYFCRFDETESVMICPNKRMPKLSDLGEQFDEKDPLAEWKREHVKRQ